MADGQSSGELLQELFHALLLKIKIPPLFKSQKTVKIIIFILLLALYSSIILHKFQLPAALDMPRFLQDGQQMLHHGITRTNYYSYTEPDTPFINYSWLASIIFYIVYKIGGFVALNFFGLIVLLGAFAILFKVALKFADFYLVALVSLPAILVIGIRSDVRPEIFSYLFISLYLLLLYNFKENPKSKKYLWLIPAQLVWVNTHIFFYIGPAIVAGFLLERLVLNFRGIKTDPIVKKLAWLLLALTAVCLINPFGWSGATVLFTQWKGYLGLPFVISENISVRQFLRQNPINDNLATQLFMPLVLVLATSFLVGFQKRRRPVFLFILALGATLVSYSVLRGLALFGMAFLLVTAANLNNIFLKLKFWLIKTFPKKKALLTIAILLFFACTIPYLALLNQKKGLANGFEAGVGLSPLSNAGADFFTSNHLKGPIFNDADIGSYIIFKLFPKERTFTDNRFGTAYSNAFFMKYQNIFNNTNVWQTLLAQYNFNTIFFYQQDGTASGFLYDRAHDPLWSLVYSDRYSLIFVKNTLANQKIIDKYQITPQNVQNRLQSLVSSSDPNDQIAAADIFNMVGRNDLAFRTDSQVVARWPGLGRIWFVLGDWELLSSKQPPAQYSAIADLQNAISRGYQTSETYTYLGAAYFNLHFINEAKKAAQKAVKLDPTNQDAKALMNVVQNGQ